MVVGQFQNKGKAQIHLLSFKTHLRIMLPSGSLVFKGLVEIGMVIGQVGLWYDEA